VHRTLVLLDDTTNLPPEQATSEISGIPALVFDLKSQVLKPKIAALLSDTKFN
jgi:hypothetical protein